MGEELALGNDPRYSGPALKASFLAAALENRAKVLDYGLIPTPALAFQTKALGRSAGIMITASHNPPEYNGFKVFNMSGEALDDETRLSLKNPKPLLYNGRASSLEPADPREYRELLSRIVFKKWKVVLDCGNGAASQLAPSIYRERLDKVTSINSYPDGGFPGRGSEPTRKSVQTLGSMVVETHFDAGIAFDGDADRMYIVDEKGVCPCKIEYSHPTSPSFRKDPKGRSWSRSMPLWSWMKWPRRQARGWFEGLWVMLSFCGKQSG